MQVWLLLSGGIDSTACLAFYLTGGYTVNCIHVSFGQASAEYEEIAAKKVAQYYNAPLTIVRWLGSNSYLTDEIIGRNAFLMHCALIETGQFTGILATGIHAGTHYYDCSPVFVSSMQTVFDGYTDGRVRIAAPFLEWSKRQVYEYSRSTNVPIDLTYSCEMGMPSPCNACASCRDRTTFLDVL